MQRLELAHQQQLQRCSKAATPASATTTVHWAFTMLLGVPLPLPLHHYLFLHCHIVLTTSFAAAAGTSFLTSFLSVRPSVWLSALQPSNPSFLPPPHTQLHCQVFSLPHRKKWGYC